MQETSINTYCQSISWVGDEQYFFLINTRHNQSHYEDGTQKRTFKSDICFFFLKEILYKMTKKIVRTLS